MGRILGVPDLIVFILLIGTTSWTLARPLSEKESSDLSSQDDFIVGLMFRDLLSDGNSPVKSIDGKKLVKNASGKLDEGGYYKTYGSDAEGEKGYVKQRYSNGDHGYKTLDTFHKKDGDNYGFEKHTAFGKARGAGKGGSQGKSGAYRTKVKGDDDHEGAGTIVDTYYIEEDGDNAALTEAEEGGGDGSGESASYTDGGDGENYTADDGGDAAEYNEGGSDSGNYGNSDGYNEHYSSGDGDEGSYGTHGSYTSGGDGGGFYGGEYY